MWQNPVDPENFSDFWPSSSSNTGTMPFELQTDLHTYTQSLLPSINVSACVCVDWSVEAKHAHKCTQRGPGLSTVSSSTLVSVPRTWYPVRPQPLRQLACPLSINPAPLLGQTRLSTQGKWYSEWTPPSLPVLSFHFLSFWAAELVTVTTKDRKMDQVNGPTHQEGKDR